MSDLLQVRDLSVRFATPGQGTVDDRLQYQA